MSVKPAARGKKTMGKQVIMNSIRQAVTIAVLTGIGAPPLWAQEDQQTKQDQDQDQGQNAMPGMDHSTMPAPPATGHEMHQGKSAPGMEGMDHSTMPGMDHGAMPGQQQNSIPGGMDHNTTHGTDHGSAAPMSDSGMTDMSGMNHGSMQGGSAPADARDPHAYSGGYTLDSGPYVMPGPRQLRLADEHNFGSLLVDRLEAVRTSDNTAAAYDLQAWYGRDYDRVVFKAEGDYDNGDFEEAGTELLWGHAVAAYWDSQLGLRYDSGEGPDRTWLAFGMQGLAPYWFEVDATVYIGDEGRTALNVEAEYELLLSQKLILQPRLEADFYGKDDSERGIGSGLSEMKAGLRLRYEIRREFAPYVGVEWAGTFGGSADYARAAGLDTNETRAVAGVRFWF